MAQSSEVSASDQGTAAQYNNLRDDALGSILTNKSGTQRTANDVVIQDTGNSSAFTTTTTKGNPLVIGVVTETIANNGTGLVQDRGIATVTVDAATSIGDYLITATTAANATPVATQQRGVFAVALTAAGGAGTVSARLLPQGGIGQVSVAATSVYNAAAPVAFTDLDLSAQIGAVTAVVMLRVENNAGAQDSQYQFRENGFAKAIGGSSSAGGASMALIIHACAVYIIVKTDAAGVIEWIASDANSTQIYLIAYWR